MFLFSVTVTETDSDPPWPGSTISPTFILSFFRRRDLFFDQWFPISCRLCRCLFLRRRGFVVRRASAECTRSASPWPASLASPLPVETRHFSCDESCPAHSTAAGHMFQQYFGRKWCGACGCMGGSFINLQPPLFLASSILNLVQIDIVSKLENK